MSTHYYRWKRQCPALYRRRCRVVARGSQNSVLIELDCGTRHVVSRFAVRLLPPGGIPGLTQ